VISTFSAPTVSRDLVVHLELRRPALLGEASSQSPEDLDAAIRLELRAALEPVRRQYAETGLPLRYFEALESELLASLPARWRQVAAPFTALERRAFGLWRDGDLVARLVYTFVGLLVGGFIWWAPFIPIWEKWLPGAMAFGGWWVPDLQTWWLRRRYARALGQIVQAYAGAQRQLDRSVTSEDLLTEAPKRQIDHEREH
jgi:hypothetical protein